MLKRIISVFIVSLMIISCPPLSCFALENAKASSPNAPGGVVTTPSELIAALGGDGITYENGVITVIKDVVLASSIKITSGSYTIYGKGATVKGAFDGNVFMISGEGSSLTLGEKDSDSERSDLIFDGASEVREHSFIKVEKGAKLELCSVLIKDAAVKTSGAAVYNEGEFVMSGAIIENCRAERSGGAVYNIGSATFSSGSITNCSANSGGAIYNEGTALLCGTTVTKCKATDGGAIFTSNEFKLLSSEITECSATRGGAIYNSGKAEIMGGSVRANSAENGEGGGVYSTSELSLSGSVISENKAKNGGNVYNSGNVSTGENFTLTGGNAMENGGNIYNSELGIFTQNSGSVNLGKAKYGGGVFNLGTYNLSGGGIYSNKAEVAEGLLNHGKTVLSNYGYCEKGDDIFVVLTPENKHAVVVSENWAFNKRPVPLSSGIYENGTYSYSHSKGDKLLDINGKLDAGKRFMLHISDVSMVLSSDGTLKKAPMTVSSTLVTVVCIAFAYPLVTISMVYVIRHFDKKKTVAK